MRQHIGLKLLILGIALTLVVIHLLWPVLPIDLMTLGLLGVALLPWLSPLIESAEFPGGWKITLRELKDEQKRQGQEIRMLQFLVDQFVTEDELAHLQKLDTGEPFPFQHGPATSFFEQELRRLRAFGLIAGKENKGIRTLFHEGGDVKNHFYITTKGREYLHLREQARAAQTEMAVSSVVGD